ncbi:hypothetical protein HII36_53880 [Nonomuraea sp. NN258]|uniref:hypothetical protein n=1 Tax=Nonomuraea antri TaxID=2730852 RepID=UPI00156943B2|nr:hypothetical protein [Nonomuraea antri]NRQ40645.1 hypothetical protein [Nonomuraea antri]
MRKTFIAAALLAVSTAACAGQPPTAGVASVQTGSGSPSASASPSATLDRAEQGRKFAQCMREHGVPMEDPDPNSGAGGLKTLAGQGVDKEKIKKAAEACRALAPGQDRARSGQDVERMRAFAACMRDNGVDIPDPDASGEFPSGTAGKFKPDDPAFQKAFEACQGDFPRAGGGS